MKKFLAACLILCSLTLTYGARQPLGLERLFSPGDDVCGDSVWTNSNADGARLRFDWATYEPTEGAYFWLSHPGDCTEPNAALRNDLACAIQKAYASGKFLGISFSAGVNSPEWIYNTPIPKVYKFNLDPADISTPGEDHMPLVWDTVYQTKVSNFLNALSAYVATLPGNSVVRYWVTGFVAKQVDMSTWCQNFDQSIVVTDAVLTTSGSFCQVVSSQAHFLTTSNPNNTAIYNGITGKVLGDCLLGECSPKFRGNSQVCQNSAPSGPGYNAACPANPTDTTVYVNKTAFSNGTTTATIENWLTNLGEYGRMDSLAKTPPPGYPGLTANPNGMTDAACPSGNACGSYVAACEAIVGLWASAFPNSNLILTRSAPYATSQGQTDSNHVNTFLSGAYGDRYGAMSVARQASCPPHVFNPGWQTGPGGSQAIYPTGHSGIYQGGFCAYQSTSILQDLLEAFIDHSNKFWEVYPGDVQSADPLTGDPALAAMTTYERSRIRFFNPQTENRATITAR